MGQDHDLVVIGLGSAGIHAATFAAELGLRVAAVERSGPGGSRVWNGCVPSKALLASARVAHTVRCAGDHGIAVGEPDVDLAAVWRRIRQVRDDADVSADRLAELGIELIEGTARVTGAREVTVDTANGDRVLTTKYVLICTGSRPTIPQIPGVAIVPALTNETIFDLDRPPASVAMIGGGPIAAELSQALVRLGVPTTVLGAGPRLLMRDEPELTDRLTRSLRGEGVVIHLGSAVTEVAATSGGVEVRAGDTRVRAEALVIAAGRTSNVENLGLDRLGIAAGPRGITVDGRSRTIVPNIYAVGDAAAGRPRFTHAATHDAVTAVRDMFLPGRGLAAGLVPWCTFTDPELARVGLTAAEAREKYGKRAVSVHRHELADNDRARADGRTDGAVIVVTAKRRIVGAHVLSPAAGELIHGPAMAIRFGLDLADLAELVHVSPTYASGVGRLGVEQVVRRRRRYRAVAKLERWLG